VYSCGTFDKITRGEPVGTSSLLCG